MKLSNYQISHCKGCQASIIWLRNIETEKMMPVDPLPAATGNLALLSDRQQRVMKSEALKMFRASGGELHTSHFSTCPNANSFRKK